VKPLGAQAQTPADVFLRLAKVAGEDILVGGQALAMWVEHYGIAAPEGVAAISDDTGGIACETPPPRRSAALQAAAGARHAPSTRSARRALNARTRG
jgi:hypothetical protein